MHTPGPWAFHCDGTSKTLTGADHYDEPYVAVVGSDGGVVCDNAHYYARGVHTDDMRLIAAAPDLLAELEEYSGHAKEIIGALLAAGGRDNLLLADKINRRHPIRFKLISRARGRS